MRKTGRPPTPEKEQVTVIRLQKKHVDMLDKVIRERAERDLDDVKLGPEERMSGTDVSTWTSYVEPINYSSERRKLVAMLIEKGVSDDALYPTRVVPRCRERRTATSIWRPSRNGPRSRASADRERPGGHPGCARAEQAAQDEARAAAAGVHREAQGRDLRRAGGT